MDKLEFEDFEVNASDDDQGHVDDVRNSEEQAVKFSSSVVRALEHKAKEHNSEQNNKVNVSQLKKIYRRGAQKSDEQKGLCAMARVNMYLRMKKDGKITYQKPATVVETEGTKLTELIFESKATVKVNTFVDITEDWLPIDADFAKAKEDIDKFELNYDFKDVNDLYLDEYEKLDITWG